MKLFGETLAEANRTIFNPAGLNLLHPRKVAFLFVSELHIFSLSLFLSLLILILISCIPFIEKLEIEYY